jgi:small ligand-binding sensory domain FIST
MKYLIYTLLIAIFTSCTSQKNAPKIKETQPLTQLKSLVDTLTTEERNIVNDFLDIELAPG